MTRDFGRAMRAAAVTEALRAGEERWFAREARHHLVFTLAHLAALVLALYVLLTAPPAAGYHGGRLAALFSQRWG